MTEFSEQVLNKKIDETIGFELIISALKDKKRVKLSFRGKSMEPSIKDGEKIFVEKVSMGQIKIGDVIIFNKNGSLIGHRVLWKFNLGKIHFLTKGDNSKLADRPINAENVYGRVIFANKVAVVKINFRIKVGFLLDIFLSKIVNILKDSRMFKGSNLSRFRGNLFRIVYSL